MILWYLDHKRLNKFESELKDKKIIIMPLDVYLSKNRYLFIKGTQDWQQNTSIDQIDTISLKLINDDRKN
jgi:hypothetical protein